MDTYLSLAGMLALQDSFGLDVFAFPTESSTKSYVSRGSGASAPRDFICPTLAALQTPATAAPRCFAYCTAAVPEVPDAPQTSTLWPGWLSPFARYSSVNSPPQAADDSS